MKRIILFIFFLSLYSCNTTNNFVPDSALITDEEVPVIGIKPPPKIAEPATPKSDKSEITDSLPSNKSETTDLPISNKVISNKIEIPVVVPPPFITETDTVIETETIKENKPAPKPEAEIENVASEETDIELGSIVLVDGISGIKMSPRGIILTLTHPIIFAENKSIVEKQYNVSIKAVKNFIEANSDIKQVIVEGHADSNTENNARSYNLSNQRALNTIDAIARTGISRLSLVQSAVGSAIPAGKSIGRKVEFIIIKSEEDMKQYRRFVNELNVKR